MKKVIPKKDFDFYSVKLPFSVIFKRQRKNFLENELEKLHPLFSGRCWTKAKYRLKKEGLIADIAVVDKLTLADYEEKFPGQKLFLEGKSHFYKRREGTKKLVFTIAAVLGGGMIFFNSYLTNQKETQNMKLVFGEQHKVEKAVKQDFPDVDEMADLIFQRVYERKGKISSFSWKNGTVSFFLENCHPEEIVSDRACSVSYKNGMPSFSVSFRTAGPKIDKSVFYSTAGEIQPLIRKQIIRNRGSIQLEKSEYGKLEIKFLANTDCFQSIIRAIEKELDLNFWHVSFFSLESGTSGLFIHIGFEDGVTPSQSFLGLVADYSSLFELYEHKLILNVSTKAPVVNREKIGEIKKKDGTVFVYYKVADGKIVVEEGAGR